MSKNRIHGAKKLLSDIFDTENVCILDDFPMSYDEVIKGMTILNRNLVEDYYFSNMSLEEIAEKYDQSIRWAAEHLQHALNYFKKENIRCYFIHGYTFAKKKKEVEDKFVENKNAIEWMNGILGEIENLNSVRKTKIEELSSLSKEQKEKLLHKNIHLVEDLYQIDLSMLSNKAAMYIADSYAAETIRLENLELSPRIYNALEMVKIHTLADLINLTEKELFEIRNLGTNSIEEIKESLKKYGYTLSNKRKIRDIGREQSYDSFIEELVSDIMREIYCENIDKTIKKNVINLVKEKFEGITLINGRPMN